ncbi:MAG TPA: AAA family ATPase, partial [Candidatus Dormibacteraeota bacterium]|nr:AAA family ATPase [Candidatus Dormibacteraeota bacterium]
MTRGLRARLLGRFSVQIDAGTPAGPWQRPAARRLVQILLLRPGHRISRESLSELLFPGLPPQAAARSVSKALAMARTAFGPDRDHVLGANTTTVWIDPSLAVETDLEQQIARLCLATERPPSPERDRELAQLLGIDGEVVEEDPYADWAIPARESYEEVRRQARLELARGRASGSAGAGPAAVVEAWRACLAVDPTEEEAAAGLMFAYLAQGQRDLAIRTFHRCRAALKDELAVEPGPALLKLYDDAVASVWEPSPRPRLARSGSPGRPPLRGRRALLVRLLQLLSREDTPSLLLSGPPGIGKTRLLEELSVELGERGWTVIGATASPDDLRAPLATLRRLLPELLQPRDRPVAPSLQRLSGSAGDDEADAGEAPPPDARRLAAEVRQLLDTAGSQARLAVVLDDAHWWDRGMHRMVEELAEPRGRTRWALVIAARSGEPKAAVPRLPPAVLRFELPALSERATEAVVSDAARGRRRLLQPLRAAIATRSVGNPFFAVELTRQALAERTMAPRPAGSSRVPARIIELLQGRLHRCSGAAQQLLPVAALAGEHAGYELLIGVGRRTARARSPEEVIRALDELVAADLLVEEPSGVRLVHPLLLDAALAGINPVHRGVLHSQIAEALEQMGPGPGGAWQEAAARHRLSAFESCRLRTLAPAAARCGFAAGHRARDLLAREAAVELFHGARSAFEVLEGAERDRLRGAAVAAAAALGDCLLDSEDDRGAGAAYRWGLELAETDEERGRLWSALGGVGYRHGDMAAAALAYERGLASLTGAGTAARARLLSDLGWARQRQGRYRESLRFYEQALPALEAAGDDATLAWTLDRLA